MKCTTLIFFLTGFTWNRSVAIHIIPSSHTYSSFKRNTNLSPRQASSHFPFLYSQPLSMNYVLVSVNYQSSLWSQRVAKAGLRLAITGLHHNACLCSFLLFKFSLTFQIQCLISAITPIQAVGISLVCLLSFSNTVVEIKFIIIMFQLLFIIGDYSMMYIRAKSFTLSSN